MSQTAEARPRAALSQPNASDIGLKIRFEGWDCTSEEVRTWAFGSRKWVVSLVRVLDEKEEDEGMGFSTPMEVTIAPMSLYEDSTSWCERVSDTYQVGVYPNVNPDWGSIEAKIGAFKEALDIAEKVCADLKAEYDLVEAEASGRESVSLSSCGPKPTFSTPERLRGPI